MGEKRDRKGEEVMWGDWSYAPKLHSCSLLLVDLVTTVVRIAGRLINVKNFQ